MTTSSSSKPWVAEYAPGVPHEVPPVAVSLYEFFAESVRQHQSSPALEFFGRRTTYGELQSDIDRAAEGLRRLGVRPGDRVAINLPNCPQHIAAFYAVLRLGAIVVEHNPLYTAAELERNFRDHGAKVAIAWRKVVPALQQLPDGVRPATIIDVDLVAALPMKMRLLLKLPIAKARESREALTEPVSDTIGWPELLAGGTIDPAVPGPAPEDVALLLYTSGTTGAPKGAMLSHANLITNAQQIVAWTPTVSTPGAVVYGVMPMFHAYGLSLGLTYAMSIGAKLVLFPRFDPDMVLDAVRREPADLFAGAPPIYQKVIARARERGVSLQGIGLGVSGAMPLPLDIAAPWEELTGGMLVEAYGLSETSPALIANPISDRRRVGWIGVPISSTDVRIVDPEEPTRELPFGEAGEILGRGPQVYLGYWGKPEETAETFVPADDGGADWFRTGDIGVMDEHGFIRVVDRIKELIITGGFNVGPSEVENVLRDHPAIQDLAVVGLPDATSGEAVVAAVVLAEGATLDESAIRTWARERLTPYKVPKRVVAIDELPRNILGKVLRRQARLGLLESED